MKKSIIEILEKELDNIEYEKCPELSENFIKDFFDTLKNIDKDMSFLMDLMYKMILDIEDKKKRIFYIRKVLYFYGLLNNTDILNSRQKFVVEEGKLVKKPFLKKSQKECINIFLKGYEVL